jgi:DNA-binding transcriptional regulator YiaG
MASIETLLKSEITRLARKEVRAQVEPLRKSNAGFRRDIAELKRQLAQVSRQVKTGERSQRDAPTSDTGKAPRFSAKGMKALRAKLGLSAADFGKLAGVSAQSIYDYETGKAIPRAAQVASLAKLRGLGKREALARLEANTGAKKKK